jgi:tetratricopeptide (TPR) repeat protein
VAGQLPASRTNGDCVDADTAAAYVAGSLTPGELAAVERHIDVCSACRRELSELVRSREREVGQARDRTDSSSSDVAATTPMIGPGARIGRYVVVETLGAGGMGVVFRAQDPELGRLVALKMVRAVDDAEALQSRLIREAQAMARLSHPNVVTVYDLLIERGRLFIAMELIEGMSLARWLTSAKRNPKEIVQSFVAAGRGLAAAHSAGLVHRDFKPDNVLVDERRGRVCVTDFGLARPEAAETSTAIDPFDLTAPDSLVSAAFTKTGALLGTPAYMAPEQYKGDPVDGRSDQFAFCVSLYEALYGEAPFAGETVQARAAAVLAGTMRSPPPRGDVPTWIRRVLLRGLSVKPDERFPSMDALLSELARDRGRRVRYAVAVVTVMLAASAAVLAVRHRAARAAAEAEALCPPAKQRLSGVWDTERKAAIERAFLATGSAQAGDVWRATAQIVDPYAGTWSEMYDTTCKATSPTGLELRRRACIEDRLLEIRALGDLLEHADAKVVSHSVEAAQGLPALARCDDPKKMAARPPLPADPAMVRRILEVRQEIARAKLARKASSFKEELGIAAHAVEGARKVGYKPLEAEALTEYGDIAQLAESPAKAEGILREAVATAEAAGDDRTKAIALIALYNTVRSEEKKDLVPMVREQTIAAVERLGGDEELELLVRNGVGSDYLNMGEPEKAEPYLRRALELSEKVYGVGSKPSAALLVVLSVALGQEGKHEDALEIQQRAAAIFERTAGPQTPAMMYAHLALSLELLELLRAAEAEGHLRIAVPIAERGLGADKLSFPLDTLGRALSEQGKYTEAIANHQRALAIHEKVDRPNHPDLVDSTLGLGRAYVGLKQPARAIPPLEKCIALEAPGKRFEQAEAQILLATALSATHRSPQRVKDLATKAQATLRAHGKGPLHDRNLALADALLQPPAGRSGGSAK